MAGTTIRSDSEGTTATRAIGGRRADTESAMRVDHLERGSRLGRYTILERVGRGGMGVVYAAYDPKLDRRVALKVLRARHRSDEHARARLLREARAIARLSHPNVIAVYDVGLLKDGIFFAMEYVPGRDLARWLADEKPEWPRIVELMVQAGRGLAAAHASGLVHRDFKPVNVIVGDDGRVRVLDFGLARPPQPDNDGESSDVRDPELTPNEYSSQTPVTQAGAVVGTPYYMSPEQFRNQADERSDQYSFCVALFEALYGMRPFETKDRREVRSLVLRGERRPPPSDTRVPARYQAIIERGLSLAPEDRYPSMDALLAALSRTRRRLWRVVAVVAALAIITVAVVVSSASSRAAEACPSAANKLTGVWDASRRSEVHKAFRATGAPYADTAFATAAAALDVYADDWLAMHRDTCLATEVRHEQSARLLDLRMMCLRQRLDELDALTDQLAHADARVVRRAVQAVGALPRLSRCANTRTLTERIAQPGDPKTRQRIAKVRKQLAKIGALNAAGKYRRAIELSEPAVASARAIGYAPLSAQALSAQGRAQLSYGKPRQAAVTLTDAFLAALAGRDDLVAMRAATKLVFAVGYRLGRHEQGNMWARTAKAIRDRGDPDPVSEGDVENNLAMMSVLGGHYDAAEKHARRALKLRRLAFGEDNRGTGIAYHTLAVILKKRGAYRKALAAYRKALAIHRRLLGDDHPDVAMSQHNIGVVLKRLHDNRGAKLALKRALNSWERSLPKNHPNIGMALFNLGAVEINLGHLVDAGRDLERARAIKASRLGANHWSLARVDLALGEVLHLQGHERKALERYEGAAKRLEAGLGGNHPEVAGALAMVADARLGSHDYAGAAAACRRALAIYKKAGAGAAARASVQFLLARALSYDPAQRDEATSAAKQALAGYRGTKTNTAQIAYIEQWLARRTSRRAH